MYLITTHDGRQIGAATASLTLFYWYARLQTEQLRSQSEEPISDFETGVTIPGPYHRMFLRSVTWAAGRTFGHTPAISLELLENEWYATIPEEVIDWREVVRLRRKGDFQIVAYELACKTILKWLKKHGDVLEVTIGNGNGNGQGF